MLNKIAIYPKNNEDLELYGFLTKYSPIQVELRPKIKDVKNSHVFISHYDRKYMDLDNSNEINFLSRKNFSNKEMLLLGIIDNIITNTYYDSLILSWQLQLKGYNKHIINLIPWCSPKPIKDGITIIKADEKHRKAFFGRTISNHRYCKIMVYLDEEPSWPSLLIEGMLGGAVPIVFDKPPFNEFIIHGYNGFLIRNPGDIVSALRKIDDGQMWLSHNAKALMTAQLNPTRYYNTLVNLKGAPGIKLSPAPSTFKDRIWLVRERIIKNGKLTYCPEQYRKDLTVIDLNDAQEVLEYFLTQNFSDVYVFGCNIPDHLEKRNELHLARMINKMGPRALKIHFCTDEPIPKMWESIFSHLSVISVEEGLKQVI